MVIQHELHSLQFHRKWGTICTSAPPKCLFVPTSYLLDLLLAQKGGAVFAEAGADVHFVQSLFLHNEGLDREDFINTKVATPK